MTEKLYDEERYGREFTAEVQSTYPWDKPGQWAVVLNRTLFYPEGGGQPADKGMLNGYPVLDVQMQNGQIVHVVEGGELQGEVRGTVDWGRRFDHMQQHTGEHLLLGAFFQLFKANSCGFHLGDEVSHLDLDQPGLTPEEIFQAEELANAVIFSNRTVTARFLADGAPVPPMRKEPTKEFQALRVVEVEDFDRCPCGGTHVAKTGEVGLVKIIGQDRKKDRIRLFYLAGNRALQDYDRKNRDLAAIGTLLSMPPAESLAAVERQKEKLNQLNQRHNQMQSRLAGMMAEKLIQTGVRTGSNSLVIHQVPEEDGPMMEELSRCLSQEAGVIFALAGTDPRSGRSQLVIGRSGDGAMDMKQLLARVQTEWKGKGGGTPQMARLQLEGAGEFSELLDFVRQEVLKQTEAEK